MQQNIEQIYMAYACTKQASVLVSVQVNFLAIA